MTSLVGKIATVGLTGGLVAPLVLANPKTEKSDKVRNSAQTAVGVAALTGLTLATKDIVTRNPETVAKIATKTGTFIEKAIKFVAEKAPKVLDMVKTTKVGNKVLEVVSKVAKKAGEVIGKNANLKNVVQKVVDAVKNFGKMSTAKKGKVGLIAAGVALLTAGALNLIKNHYKKEGAIEQKYETLRADYERMLTLNPIMDARTGEPISFEDYCKAAQTYLK